MKNWLIRRIKNKLIYIIKLRFVEVITIFMVFSSGMVNAKEPAKVVFLDFDNNLSDKYFVDYAVASENGNMAETIKELLFDRLFETNEFILVELSNDEEVLKAASKLNPTSKSLSNLAAKNDFSAVFQASENDISTKGKGDYVKTEYSRVIGKKNNVEYILYGSIDDMAQERESYILPVGSMDMLGYSSESKKVFITIKIIRASTGEIVWERQEKAAAKNSSAQTPDIAFSSRSDNLYYEVLDKVSKNITKALVKDLKKGNLIL